MHRSLLHMQRVDLSSLPKCNSFRSVSLSTQLAKATNCESIPSIQTLSIYRNQDPSTRSTEGTLIISHCRMVLATRKTRNKRTIRIKSARRIARKEFIPLLRSSMVKFQEQWWYLDTSRFEKRYMVIYNAMIIEKNTDLQNLWNFRDSPPGMQ